MSWASVAPTGSRCASPSLLAGCYGHADRLCSSCTALLTVVSPDMFVLALEPHRPCLLHVSPQQKLP